VESAVSIQSFGYSRLLLTKKDAGEKHRTEATARRARRMSNSGRFVSFRRPGTRAAYCDFSRFETAEQSTVTFNSSVHTVTSGRAFLLLGEHCGKGRGQISIGAAKRRSINSHRKERFGALDKIARARVAVAGSHRRRVLRSQLSKRFEVPHLPAPAA
jgi:hypothetical protein